VYILASKSRVLYVGMTNDLRRRMFEHRAAASGFTSRYRVNRLVYFEVTENPAAAIAREKELKGWRRTKKRALIEATNPSWDDLARRWFEAGAARGPAG
jgi:putative endonuclease